ncbi:MAG: SgcJ/EcaC family oxidoreductase [Planctomycetaceae bacterium]
MEVPHVSRERFPVAFVHALIAGGLLAAGCSSGGDARSVGRMPAAEPELVAATTSANPAGGDERLHTIRPVPDVVSRPRPFRLPASVGVPPAAPTLPTATESPAEPRLVDASVTAAPLTAAEIRDMLRSYLRAFNQHDAAALAAHWRPAGESVDLDSGDVTSGREAVREVFAALFAEDEAATIDIDVTTIRPIRDDVAVVDGVTRVDFADGLPAGSRFTAVVVREGGRWLLDSVREAAQPQAAAAARRPLDDLAWLVGAWEDSGPGVTAGTQCFWSAGRGFLVRSHAVQPDAAAEPRAPAARPGAPDLLPPGDASARELTEIIGWDADRGTIRSWLFTSAGRFAEATWTRAADGRSWTVAVEGRGRDEGARCTCTVAADGADGLVMTCDSDALAGLLPPACGFVRTARLGAPAAE